jgi:hypothetical protein
MPQGNRYLVIVSVGNASAANLMKVVPKVKEALTKLSSEPLEQAFRAVSGDTFGFFIRSQRQPGQIVAALQSPGGPEWSDAPFKEPFLGGADNLFVIELGEKFYATTGFGRAGTWLQRH